ncbi:MAG: CapA family protein, partial [Bdellovibrionales bacterium]|nr:CapA family protein [Bdellovibrionales bacterium]
SEDFHVVMEQGGLKTLWVACAYGTNGLPDKQDLVLDCFDTGRVSQIIKANKDSYDAVIVTPHWGNEYQLTPNTQQKNFGRQWLEDGALAVIGAHPHVPQTWEKYKTKDGREGAIVFSLGNFVSNQSSVNKKSSLIFYLGLTKNNGKTWINGVRYVPLYMDRAQGYQVLASNQIAKPSAEQKASLKLLKEMFGEERLVKPGEDVITNAECF